MQQTTQHKLSNNVKQRLDSIVVENLWKEAYAYDHNGYAEVKFDSSWNMNQWKPMLMREYAYSNGNVETEVDFSWNDTANQWEPENKNVYEYDTTYHISNLLVPGWYSWKNMLTGWQEYQWNNNQWNITFEFVFHYSPQAVANASLQRLDNVTAIEDGDPYMIVYAYDTGSFNMTSEIWYDWDIAANQWVAWEKHEYAYALDSNVHMTLTEDIHEWDFDNGGWITSGNNEYIFDHNGNPLSEVFFSNWEHYRREFSYDPAFTLSDLMLPPLSPDFTPFLASYSAKIINKPIDFKEFSPNGNDWLLEVMGVYYYSEQAVSHVAMANDMLYQIYPNPASDYIHIRMQAGDIHGLLKLYDMQAREVMSREIAGDAEIFTGALQPGIYFYNMITDGRQQSGKLVKE